MINKSENSNITLFTQQEIITKITISKSNFNKVENNNNKEEEDESADNTEEQDNKNKNVALIRPLIKKYRVSALSV